MFSAKRFSKDEALKKIKHYCSYQERSHNEVKEKLYSFGLFRAEVEEMISSLIEERYLNEERYAKQFAGGKFRMKHWGRKKILYELQQKGVNKANIKLALKEIPEEEYLATVTKLAGKKWLELKGQQHLVKKAKTTAYLLQKGYEPDLISKLIGELSKTAQTASER